MNLSDKPSPPRAAISSVPGELVFIFSALHVPARPGPPESRWKVIVSFDDSPDAFITFDSTVSVLPSSDNFILSVLATLPLTLLTVSHSLSPWLFHVAVV